VSLLLTALAGALLTQGQPGSLQLRKGDSWSAILTLRYVDSGAEIDETHVEKLDSEVTSTSPLTVKVSRRFVETRINGDVIPVLQTATPDVYTETWSPDNGLLQTTRSAPNPGHVRMDRLFRIAMPGGTKQTWRTAFPGNPELSIPGAAGHYSILGGAERDGRPTTRLKFRVAEDTNPAIVADGTAELDNATGLAISIELKATNIQMPGGTDRVRLEATHKTTRLPKRP
jgi:hypothetical protein